MSEPSINRGADPEPPNDPAEDRAWGPSRALAGIAVVLVLALIEGGVVVAIEAAPSLRPVAIAAQPTGAGGSPLFALNADTDELWALEAKGEDSLREETTVDVAPDADLLAAGALDRSDELTVAVAESGADAIRLFGFEDGEFTGPRTVEVGAQAQSLAIGRLQGFDGPLLAVGTDGGRVALFGAEPEGGPTRLDEVTGVGSSPRALAIGRLDDDARADLLVGAERVVPFLARPDGRLRSEAAQGVDEQVRSLAAGDVGDGPRAFAVTLDDKVQVLRWRGRRGLAVERSLEPVDSPRSLAVAELFEGRSDLVVGSEEGPIEVLQLEDDGSFDSVTEFEPGQSLIARIVLQGLLAATLVGVAFWLANPGTGLASGWALGLRRSLRSPWGAAALAYGAYIACALALAALIQPEQEDVTRDLGFGEGWLGDLASGLLIVVAAPISEEIFFRGFVFGGLRRAAPFLVAAAASAALWGIFHFTGPGSWGVVLQLAIFGVVLAWLYERTGSIWPPIAVHAVNNALAFGILTS